MHFRSLVISLVVMPALVSVSNAFETNNQNSAMKGAATSAEAANAELGAVLKKKTMVGNHIKVADARGEHAGKLIQVTANAIAMDEETETEYIPLTIPFESVNVVWKRSRNSGRGALIGGCVGAGLGLILGLAAASDPFFEDDAGAVTIGSTVLAGSLGAGLGALIGSASHSYKIIFERQ